MAAHDLCLLAEADLERRAWTLLLEGPLKRKPRWVAGFEFGDVCHILRRKPGLILIVADRPTPEIRAVRKAIAETAPNAGVIVVTAAGCDAALLRAWALLEPHAAVSRAVEPAELDHAIKTVARGSFYFDERWRNVEGLDNLDPNMPALSPRERELLPLLATGMTLSQAAERMQVAYKTADTYRTSIFRKLGVSNRVELSRYAIREQILEA